jgi:hypothetical protein
MMPWRLPVLSASTPPAAVPKALPIMKAVTVVAASTSSKPWSLPNARGMNPWSAITPVAWSAKKAKQSSTERLPSTESAEPAGAAVPAAARS